MNFFSLENKLLVRILFTFLLIYLIFRAFFLPPYCDEISTLFEYVESKKLIEGTLKSSSANNHLLNTLLAKFFYLIFGDHFFFLRIPNILAFILYFFSVKNIVKHIINPEFQLLTFIALNTVTWIFEYFGYLRGYGLALGFLFYSIYFLMKWIESKSSPKFGLFILFLWLSVFANLSFFNTSLILFCYSVLFILMNIPLFSRKSILRYSLLSLGFIFAFIPLVRYSFKLKEAGALWWGNLDGLWKCTGYYLSEITFFTTSDYIKFTILFLIIVIGVLGLFQIKKVGLKSFILSLEGVFYLLFFGNLLMIELLALFFKINYPRDRASMQLVLFFILVVVIFIQKIKILNYSLLLLIFFPLTFCMNISLNASIYQNNLRLTKRTQHFLNIIDKNKASFSVYGLLELPLYYQYRKDNKLFFFNSEKYNSSIEPNYIIIEKGYTPPANYYKIFEDEISKAIVFKNINKHLSYLKKDTFINKSTSTTDLLLLREKSIDTLYQLKKMKVEISGKVTFLDDNTPLHLILTLGDSINPLDYYHDTDFGKISKTKKEVEFRWNSPVYHLDKNKNDISIYFWNIDQHKVIFKNLKMKLYGVD